MYVNEIKVGTKFEFEIIDSAGSYIGQSFKSELIGIVSETEIIISFPVNEARLLFISSGTKIRISFCFEVEDVLSFIGIITYKEKNGTQVLLHIVIGDDFKELQRRKYFRTECNLKSEYRLLKKADVNTSETMKDVRYKKTLTQNISSGGACILIDDNIPVHSAVDLIVWLSDEKSVKMKCKVVRCIEITISGAKNFEAGLYIENMTQIDKDILVKYITDYIII